VTYELILYETRGEVALVTLDRPDRFRAVGEFYDDFTQLADHDVVRMLGKDQG